MRIVKVGVFKIDWDWVKKEVAGLEGIAKFREEVNKCLKKAKEIAKPKILSKEKRISHLESGFIEMAGGPRLYSKKISSYLKGAESVRFFLVTIGKRLEEEASRLMREGEGLEGYILDRIGSLAAESLAEGVEEDLRRYYSKIGKSVSMRFSPGYCDWPVEEQVLLSRVLDFSKAGVRLTESYMMVPRKSISAMVGIGENKRFSKIKSPCSICDRKDCDHRRID